MKNKLYTTICHPELVEGSHPVCHSVGVSINKTPNFQISLFPNPSILHSLFSIPTHAQTYNWDWGVNGDGPLVRAQCLSRSLSGSGIILKIKPYRDVRLFVKKCLGKANFPLV